MKQLLLLSLSGFLLLITNQFDFMDYESDYDTPATTSKNCSSKENNKNLVPGIIFKKHCGVKYDVDLIFTCKVIPGCEPVAERRSYRLLNLEMKS